MLIRESACPAMDNWTSLRFNRPAGRHFPGYRGGPAGESVDPRQWPTGRTAPTESGNSAGTASTCSGPRPHDDHVAAGRYRSTPRSKCTATTMSRSARHSFRYLNSTWGSRFQPAPWNKHSTARRFPGLLPLRLRECGRYAVAGLRIAAVEKWWMGWQTTQN